MVRSARLEHLMVRSVAQRRVSNHGRPAPLSPVARPSAFALPPSLCELRRTSRATADKSRRRCAPSRDEDEGYCRPHGEERAQARVSNHGPLAPLSPMARPSGYGGPVETALHAPPRGQDKDVDGRFCCKQQRIYKPMPAHRRACGHGPALLQTKRAALGGPCWLSFAT
jgi:hypothetical protein